MFILEVIFISILLAVVFVLIESYLKRNNEYCKHEYEKMDCFGNTSRFHITQCAKCNCVRFNTWND